MFKILTALTVHILSQVYYTCENAVVTKIFQCSESPILVGTTHVCQENPRCPGIDSFEEFINIPSNLDESKISESAKSVVPTEDNKGKLPAFVNTIISFIKCLVNVHNIDGFCKTCIDTTLFQKKTFLEIEFSPKVFDVFAKMLKKSKSSEGHEPNWDTTFGKVVKDFIRYLSPQCELVCKDVSKQPKHSYEDKSQSGQHASIDDLKQSSDDGYVPDQVLPGDRVRRSPMTVFSLIRSVLMNRTQVQFPNPTVEPSTTPKSAEDVNGTLMSNVIVPIIQDIVNDEEALKNATDLFRIVFEALVPLATEILESSNEAFDSNRKPILKIPRQIVQSTIRKIAVDGHPILRSLIVSKMPPFLMLLSRNTKLLFRSWDEMESRLEPNMREFLSKGFELYRKYYGMFMSSSADFIHTYPLIEIQQDIESLYSLLPEVSRELVLENWSVFQDASGITTESISKMLLDIPGIFDAINAVPFETYVYFLLLMI